MVALAQPVVWQEWRCQACNWYLGDLIPERVPADCDWLRIRCQHCGWKQRPPAVLNSR